MPPPYFLGLGHDQLERCERYVPYEETRLIREVLERGELTGNSRLIDETEQITGLRFERRDQGRLKSGARKYIRPFPTTTWKKK